jgi:hypothetical protein
MVRADTNDGGGVDTTHDGGVDTNHGGDADTNHGGGKIARSLNPGLLRIVDQHSLNLFYLSLISL